MKCRGFSRFVFLSSLFLLALPLQAASTRELDPLAADVSAFAAASAPAGKTSLDLAQRIGWSEATARHEADAAKRQALLGRLATLRQELEAAGGLWAVKDASPGDKANGAFSGRVTDDGEPVAQTRIEVYDSSGFYRASAYTGPDGRYALSIEPGTYFLYAQPPYDRELSAQIHEGLSCFLSSSCQVTDGTPLAVASGGHRAVDFALADLGAIQGQVRRRDDLAPVETDVRVYDSELDLVKTVFSQTGSYVLGGLAPGDYWVVAIGSGDLAGMIYRGIACDADRYSYPMPCPTSGATRVRIGLDEVAEGIDFELIRGATLRAAIFDARTGTPVDSYGDIFVFDAAGNQIRRSYLERDQREILLEGLAGGTYYASVEADGYTSQFFDRRDCISYHRCRTSATPIELALGEDSDWLSFPLNRRGSVAGRVTDDRTGAAVQNVRISLVEPASGDSFASAQTDSAGFFSFSGVPAVRFHLLASDDRYRHEYFDDVDARRGPAAATLLAVGPGELTTVEIGLQARGALTARAVAAETGQALVCFAVIAYPVGSSQENFSSFDCPQDGQITLEKVPPGSYYVVVSSNDRPDYLFGKGSCNRILDSSCDLAAGARIEVRPGETTDLGTAELEQSAGLRVDVHFTAPPGSSLPAGARVQLYDSSGTLVGATFLYGYSWAFFRDLVPGDYYLVADGSPHWQSKAYPEVLCSRWYCNPFRGSRIRLEPSGQGDSVSFLLEPSTPYNGCTSSETALCLNQGRYRVSATWRDFAGASGAGMARFLTADSGYFYFFSPNNLEVLVKVLNGCAPHLGHHFWFYGAGLTNVQVQLRVEDTLTGAVELYSNALGSTFQPILDNAAFATCDAAVPQSAPALLAPAETPVLAAASALAAPAPAAPVLPTPDGAGECDAAYGKPCLAGRFLVEAGYRTPGGESGQAFGQLVTPDTATYYFFDQNNVELVVKILDACGSSLPGHWVFASGLTDIEVEMKITDRETGRTKIYRQPPGPFVPVIDLQSFPCD